tara:strand:+ start:186 stop:593 length:408 start_codon:yes stop_codon:yes gene_type:complete
MNKDFKKGFLIGLGALTALLIPTIIYIGSKAISPKDDLLNISKYCDKVVDEHQKKMARFYKGTDQNIYEASKRIKEYCNKRIKITKFDKCIDNIFYTKKEVDKLLKLFNSDKLAYEKYANEIGIKKADNCIKNYL